MKLEAYQDLTGVLLEGDVEIHGAPAESDGDEANWRFLIWVDDEVLGPDGRKIKALTAVTADGRRTPMTVFRCNPEEVP